MKRKIKTVSDNHALNLAIDTINQDKQALVFVNTKKSAEKLAEEISKKIKKKNNILSKQILNALPKPTRQCERLAKCLEKNIAFHHAGLTYKQKEIIENNFRKGIIKTICCTPTLCLSKDTMIWHNMSETEVSKFKNSNPLFVLSKNKLISMKSQKVQKIENSSKLIEISSVSGYSIKVTPNHKMLIKRKNRKIILETKHINKNDKIATIGKLKINNIKIPYIKDFIIDNETNILNYKFGPKLSYFIGLMLGDGYSGAETNDKGIKYKGSPSIVGIDHEVFSNIKNYCNQLNISCKKTKTSHGTPQLILGKNKWFREFLVRCGVEKKDKKHVSDKLMAMNLENTGWLLKGLFDTDGHLDKKMGPGFSNISERLIKQIQKMLLRFGIVSTIRKKKTGSMKIYGKEYKTMPCFEINIHQKKSIIDFYRFVGFDIKRKQNALIDLIAKIYSNLNYVSCDYCRYKIHKDLFSGRSKDHKKWGQIKLKVIKLLGKKEELGSRELKKVLNHEPKKKDSRLNHHYELIKRRRIGNRSNTEWLWSLNSIGTWIFNNMIDKDKNVIEFFGLQKCPLCKNELEWIIKKGWRDSDFEGDIFWDKIRKVEETDCEKRVYDVVLPNKPKNNHMFVANGFIVHNSYGLDLPAFRTVIKDLRRYTSHGLIWIPVLEYLQQAGRAGRPKFDSFGEAIAIASTKPEKEMIKEKYINGKPEKIYSKLAVEPVLRMYLLSLISTRFVKTKQQIFNFFEKTFWAYQFKDTEKLEAIITKTLNLLEEMEFIRSSKQDDFTSADEINNETYKPTLLGKRVAELYIDPLTAYFFITCLRKATIKKIKPFSFLQMVSHTPEIRPLLKTRVKEYDKIEEKHNYYNEAILEDEPSMFEPDYEDFVNSIKTALFFQDWIDEKDEEFLLEEYNIRPGETRVKLEISDWLLYATEEIAKLLKFQPLVKEIIKLRFRLKHGAKEELLALLKLKDIGRVRARRLFINKIKDIKDVKKADISTLKYILGEKIALSIKKQVGQEIKEVLPNKRKGQIRLEDYGKE